MYYRSNPNHCRQLIVLFINVFFLLLSILKSRETMGKVIKNMLKCLEVPLVEILLFKLLILFHECINVPLLIFVEYGI